MSPCGGARQVADSDDKTELVSPAAKSGTHLYESLATLFRLVDRGHTPKSTHEADDPAPGLEFNALRADLFTKEATALIDQVGRCGLPSAVQIGQGV